MALRRRTKVKDPETPGRLSQLRAAYRITKQHDKNIGLVVAVAFLVPLLVMATLGTLLGGLVFFLVSGVLLSLISALSVFSRRAQKASYRAVADTPGVAAAVVERMRGQWIVTPAVQLNRDQDLVHRVVGRPGVILLAEGRGAGALIGPEVRRLRKVINDTPIHVLHVGDGPDQVPLAKLQVTMVRLGRVLRPTDVTALHKRLKALPAGGPMIGIPKGPMPTRVPKGGRR